MSIFTMPTIETQLELGLEYAIMVERERLLQIKELPSTSTSVNVVKEHLELTLRERLDYEVEIRDFKMNRTKGFEEMMYSGKAVVIEGYAYSVVALTTTRDFSFSVYGPNS